jgi:predicted nucleotidyltransferase
LASIKLQDRDGILTKEGIVFRVFGSSHPQDIYICDAEYASSKIFQSKDPRAPREGKDGLFYKFYNDEGMKLIAKNYPQYLFFHQMLAHRIVGVNQRDILEALKPQPRLQEIIKAGPTDPLIAATLRVLNIVTEKSGLKTSDLGVFGSMLHNFHHPKYSDIDFTIYGRTQNQQIYKTLQALYEDKNSGFRNEFESEACMAGKRWLFKNFTVEDFVWHQRRKMIYGLYDDTAHSGRVIKAEFEPVKAESEIVNEYDPNSRIIQLGWTRMRAKVTSDADAPFIPSIYGIEPLEVLSGLPDAMKATRVFSYMEEFRSQARASEEVIVEGTLEQILKPHGETMYQVTLTYCPLYWEQVLKVIH